MKHIITTVFALTMLVAPVSAFATLDVTFESTPLFDVSGFSPGDTISKTVDVSNTGSESAGAYSQLIGYTDPDNLGSQLTLRILDGSTELFSGTFDDFSSVGQVSLSTIPAGSSDSYTYEVTFLTSAGDDYQEKVLGFDLCVGFSGGPLDCGDTDDGGGGGSNPPGGGGGSNPPGGGGGGGGPTDTTPLDIFNEQVLSITVGPVNAQDGTADIFWNTNRPATSWIVYGLASGSQQYPNCNTGLSGSVNTDCYILEYPSGTNFGYPMTTGEDLSLIVDHTMTLTNLIPGETYVLRVVSRETSSALPTISSEFPFTLAFGVGGNPDDGTPPEGPTGPTATGPGAAGGSGTGGEGDTSPTDEGLDEPGDGLAAAAFLGIPPEIFEIFTSIECIVISIIILLAIYAIWTLLARLLKWDQQDPKGYAWKRMLTFAVLLIAAMVLAFFFGYWCIILPLLIAFLISVVWLSILIARSTGTGGDASTPETDEVDTIYEIKED